MIVPPDKSFPLEVPGEIDAIRASPNIRITVRNMFIQSDVVTRSGVITALLTLAFLVGMSGTAIGFIVDGDPAVSVTMIMIGFALPVAIHIGQGVNTFRAVRVILRAEPRQAHLVAGKPLHPLTGPVAAAVKQGFSFMFRLGTSVPSLLVVGIVALCVFLLATGKGPAVILALIALAAPFLVAVFFGPHTSSASRRE